MWIIVDSRDNILGEFPTYSEAFEAAAMLETYGLRCDIKKVQKEYK